MRTLSENDRYTANSSLSVILRLSIVLQGELVKRGVSFGKSNPFFNLCVGDKLDS